ncbi:hypothetical protein D9V34_01055 [Mycetocola lacteus]|uniref:Uncharacterized protein n=1 Tax=Mycetocola lacteus TaxID=76637 RepID=A0A3L7AL97_9MICO|nr:hypothetical protein [Mycetocola lacteus]RLP80834.1 hypothetical protein D9V34_13350 [Mycetocola lacteus]RLP84619.1 hypothetical protein D9V34_01055 [Mycetocola lacteus]
MTSHLANCFDTLSDCIARGDELFAIRLISEIFDAAVAEAECSQVTSLRTAPVLAGDSRWDTLSTSAVRLAYETRGKTPPPWTEREPSPTPVYLRADRDLTEIYRERIRERTPLSLAEQNVWYELSDLATA